MRYQFGERVYWGINLGVVVKIEKKRKYTWYSVVFDDADFITNDWDRNGIEYCYIREDELENVY